MAGKTRVGPLANTSVKREAIAGPWNKMPALDKSIATGIPLKGKKKTLKENR